MHSVTYNTFSCQVPTKILDSPWLGPWLQETQGPNEIIRLQVTCRELGVTASLPDPARLSLPEGGKQLPSASLPAQDSTDLEQQLQAQTAEASCAVQCCTVPSSPQQSRLPLWQQHSLMSPCSWPVWWSCPRAPTAGAVAAAGHQGSTELLCLTTQMSLVLSMSLPSCLHPEHHPTAVSLKKQGFQRGVCVQGHLPKARRLGHFPVGTFVHAWRAISYQTHSAIRHRHQLTALAQGYGTPGWPTGSVV